MLKLILLTFSICNWMYFQIEAKRFEMKQLFRNLKQKYFHFKLLRFYLHNPCSAVESSFLLRGLSSDSVLFTSLSIATIALLKKSSKQVENKIDNNEVLFHELKKYDWSLMWQVFLFVCWNLSEKNKLVSCFLIVTWHKLF